MGHKYCKRNRFSELNLRYVDKNQSFSGFHKRYNQSIPTYLHERPRSFVKHCMEKLHLVSDIDQTEIVLQEEKCFLVKNYKVDFGMETGKLSCSCFDWKKHKLPCKHIMAIIVYKHGNYHCNK